MKRVLNDTAGRLPASDDIPPLEAGDVLARDEFERRYEAGRHLRKAELIEGVVFMPSPVRIFRHGKPQADLVCWLGVFRASTPGVIVGDNTTARLDVSNEPQPDAMLFIEPSRGGQVRIDEDDYVAGAPELVAEVSSSSAGFDLHTKLDIYRRCGVKEYIVWRVRDRAIDWFAFAGGAPERLTPDSAGVSKSRLFPGLWLDSQALLSDDLLRVISCVQAGTASTEHAQFLKRLNPEP